MHKILLDLDAIVVRSSAGLVCDIWHHCCEVRTNIRIHFQRFRQTWPKTLRVDTSKKRVSENGQTDTLRTVSPVGTGKQPVLQKQEWNMDLAAAKQGVRSGPQTRYHLTLHLKCSTKSATVPWFHAIDKLIAHYSFVISSVWRNNHDFDCRLVQTISDSLTLLVIFYWHKISIIASSITISITYYYQTHLAYIRHPSDLQDRHLDRHQWWHHRRRRSGTCS